MKTSQLMLYGDIFDVGSELHTNHTNTKCCIVYNLWVFLHCST